MKIIPVVISFYALCVIDTAYPQTFTKITDITNPVVTDQYESGGGSWIDINNDGWLDLFVANGNLTSQNNSLYINRRNGNFTKVITGAVVNDGGSSIGGAFGDYNADGNPDLFVTNRNFFKNFLYRGTGDSTFIKIITGNIVTDSSNSNCGHWVDIDRDGDLDLFVINFQGNDFLYLNSGAPSYNFTKIDTAAFLLNAADFSIPAAWGDFNNDRFPDLFVGNAGTQNDFIYKNNGNLSFSKTILADGRSTLGASFGDFNNDGYLDLFVANYINQNNILYRNSGPPDYSFIRIDTGVVSNDGGSSVGSCWGDVDNDGDLDLFVSNDNGENNFLYLNSGAPGYGFTKITTGAIVNDGGNSFGNVFGDYNNDGAIDLFVANRLNQNNFLYLNNGNSNKWLGVKCRGALSNRSAIGSKVKVKALINGQPVWQMREIVSQSGYNSENLVLNFGLGNATAADSIIVQWISGTNSVFTNVPFNRYVTLSEDGTINSINDNIAIPDKFTLSQNYPNPFNPVTQMEFGISNMGFVSLKVYNVLGEEIKTLINEIKPAGKYDITFDGSNLSSGIYFYTMKAGEIVITKRMLLLK